LERTLSREISDTTIIISNISRTSNYNIYLEKGYTNLILDTLDLASTYGLDLMYPLYYNTKSQNCYPLSIGSLNPDEF
jgi:hypothetical protein